jgi:hypothetical protein
MRKVVVLTAAVAAAAVGITGVANAVDAEQGLSIKLAANKAGTAKKPRSISKLTVTTTTKPNEAAPAYATKTAVIHFDKNLVFGASKFKSCTLTQAQAHDAACDRAKVGGGSATAVVASIGANPTLKVTAYNGPKGRNIWLRVQEPTFNIDSILEGALKSDTGKFGKKLIVTIPENLQQPIPGVYATLTQFITSVGGTSKGTPYIALKGCTGGKLNFRGDFTFTDGDVKQAPATAKCRK